MGLTPLLDLSEDFFLPLKNKKPKTFENKNVLKALQFNHTTTKQNYEQFSIKTSKDGASCYNCAHTLRNSRLPEIRTFSPDGEHKTKVFSAVCNNAKTQIFLMQIAYQKQNCG